MDRDSTFGTKEQPDGDESALRNESSELISGISQDSAYPIAETLAIGETVDRRYRILELIGMGGIGAVYKALDTRLQTFVALKTLRFSPDTESTQRFLREAQASPRLSHPNILRIYDRGEAEGLPYLALEYVEGRSLQQIVGKGQPLDVDYAIEIIRRVGAALAYAHQRGIVHRDIKPSNILISNEGRVLLADFGLAIPTGAETLSHFGTVAGTPAYMSPEQVMGLPIDARSDIFSLGVVFYELLTGHRPFSGPFSGPEVFGRIVEQDPLPPEKLNSSLSRSLGKIVLKSLAKKPEHRFQTAEAFVVALAKETGSGQYRHRTGIRRLVDFFRTAVRGDERKRVAVTCQRIEALLDSGDLGRARQEVDQALHRFPDNVDVTALRVRAQREIKAQSARRVGRSADETIQGSAREPQPERDQALRTAISHMGGNRYVEAQTLVDAIQDAVTDDQIIPYAPGSATRSRSQALVVGEITVEARTRLLAFELTWVELTRSVRDG